MEIRSLYVDIDKGILEVNGREVTEAVIVTLPGPDGWPLQRLFNQEENSPEGNKRINVTINNEP